MNPRPNQPPPNPKKAANGGGDVPYLPEKWIGTEAFEGCEEDFAKAERFFCTFDAAPERCSLRACRDTFACQSDAPAGRIHAECRGRPGTHVRHWVLGLWLGRIHWLMQPETYGLPPRPQTKAAPE